MFGKIELENFTGLTSMPQKAASAWSVFNGFCGANFKPLLYVGKQIVNGVNHWFLAEETFVTLGGERRIVLLAINELDGKYKFLPESIKEIAN